MGRCCARWRWTAALVVCVLAGAAAAVEPADPDPNSTRTMEALLPERDERPGYATSDTCRSCHPAEYRSWYDSYHRPMTQVASAETVLADFDGVQLDHYRVGQRLLLGTHEGQLYFEPLGLIRGPPDPARALDLEKARRIVLTTGSHHQQTFWVVGYQNQLFSFPFSWLVDDGRWAPRDDIILRDPSLPMGTAGWNSNCVDCHATPPGTHYERELAGASGELSELGIACEACHGGAEAHVNQSRSPLLRYEQHLDSERDMAIVRPAKLSAEASSQICGQCHAKVRYYIPQPGTEHRPYRPGDDLLETRILKRFGHRMQHTAGQELNVMVESACYRGGELSCLSCHSMHGYADRSDQLAPGMDGDAACQQCHSQAKYTTELATHTKHPAESAGSRCYECHMPKTTFGLRKAIRSHVIDSPRVQSADAPQRSERPQACNLCHLDRSLGWTAEALTKLWGQPAPSLDDDEKTVANSVLWLAKGDAAQRAVVADAMGRDVAWQASGKRWLAPFLASTLDDRYGVVRYVAGRSLARLPGFEGFEADFVAREEMRRLDRARALRRWHRTIKGSPDRTGSEILITPDGTLDTKRWEALRAGRSTRQLDQIE